MEETIQELPGMEAYAGGDASAPGPQEAQLRLMAARRIFEGAMEHAAPCPEHARAGKDGGAPSGVPSGGHGDVGAWADDYETLIAEGWSWRQAVYMVWSALPHDRRWPKTQHELATEVLGLASDRVIRGWVARNAAMPMRIARLAASALAKARAEIYAALIEAASNPSPRANGDRKLALEMLGDYVPRQQVGLEMRQMVRDYDELSTEELLAIAEEPVDTNDK